MCAIEPVRIGTQSSLAAVVDGPFLCPYATQLMPRIEIVIDTNIELIAIVLIVRIAIRDIRSVNSARKANARRIQAVPNRVIVRLRHFREERVLDKTGGVVSGAGWIASEDVELLEITRRAGRPDRVAVSIDRRIVLSRILVIGPGKEPEDALPCQRRQSRTDESLLE